MVKQKEEGFAEGGSGYLVCCGEGLAGGGARPLFLAAGQGLGEVGTTEGGWDVI